jgi:hypothetical protein
MQFPWEEYNPPPTQQAKTGPTPSVTRGKISAPPAAEKPKPTTKPKTTKKPADNNVQAAPEQPAPNEAAAPDTGAANAAAGQPNDMIGRDEAGIRSLVGAPATTRTEGSTTVWSYRKEGCALDLFLFYDVKTGALRVLSYEIKPDSTDSNAVQVCYNKFRNV